MQIQRIQSVYLLIAAILMALVNFVAPVVTATPAEGEVVKLYLYQPRFLGLFVINIIVAVILFIDIFIYKTLKLQMKVARIACVLIVVSAAFEAYALVNAADGEISWLVSALMLAASFVLTLLALKGMQSDYDLLHKDSLWRK